MQPCCMRFWKMYDFEGGIKKKQASRCDLALLNRATTP
jgi:hypothetical protein